MNSGKYIFAQIVDFIDYKVFDKCVKRYSGNYRVRDLKCWNQFLHLLFGQLTSQNSIHMICVCLKMHKRKHYHLGIKQLVDQSALTRANESRDWRIFADYATHLINKVRPLYADCSVPNLDLDNEIYALDATSISVSINLMTWAEGKYSRGAVKMHTLMNLRGSIPEFIWITDGKCHDSNALDRINFYANAIYLLDKAYVDFEALYRMHNAGAFFVSRAKATMQYQVIEQNFNIDEKTGLRADKTVLLTVKKSKKLYPEKLRIVEFYDSKNDELLVFLTNNFEISALEVALLYKNRWQIEVFFKWIKQNLVIKKFWGHSENAVKIHLWIAVIAYLLVAYAKQTLKSEYSVYEIMQVISVSAFDKTPIRELLTKQCQFNQNVKEQLYLFEC